MSYLIFQKFIVSLVLICSLLLSLVMGVVPVYAAEATEFEPCSGLDTDGILSCCSTGSVVYAEIADVVVEYNTNIDVNEIFVAFDDVVYSIDSFTHEALAVQSEYDLIEALVSRLYLDVLNRTYDTEGLAFWSNLLRNGSRTGVSVASDFFFSDEFVNRRVDNEDFVNRLYVALMDRVPDPGGRAFWLNQLDLGIPRENVFALFVNSPEFDRRCSDAGIIRGTYHPPTTGMSRAFITRMYRTTLRREPDVEGLNFWTVALENGSRTGAQISYEFIFSDEMLGRRLTDEAYVDILYVAMMGRTGDATGRAFWLNQLQNGASRYSVFVHFVNSPEFDRICREHGIVRGTPPSPRNTMPGITNVAVVWNLIAEEHFIGISDRPEHIAGIIGNLQSEAGPALCPFQIQVSNHVGLGLMQWSFGRRTTLENFMWDSGICEEMFIDEMNKHLTSYVCPPGNHPQELTDRVLAIQINFMFHELRNTWERFYMDFIDFPTNTTGVAGARAYAELFCSLALRPGLGVTENDDIFDLGVQEALRVSLFVGGVGNLERISYSALGIRRNRAEVVFRQFQTEHR